MEMAFEGEMQAHQRSYSGFIWLMKWGAIISLILGLFVVLIIS
jgi:hypothetical protein